MRNKSKAVRDDREKRDAADGAVIPRSGWRLRATVRKVLSSQIAHAAWMRRKKEEEEERKAIKKGFTRYFTLFLPEATRMRGCPNDGTSAVSS